MVVQRLTKENNVSKIGLSISINVEKLDKSRFHKGAKGTYVDLTTFIDMDNLDQYDNNGFVKQSSKKEENADLPILGNAKIFWREGGQQPSQTSQPSPQAAQGGGFDNFDDEIPDL